MSESGRQDDMATPDELPFAPSPVEGSEGAVSGSPNVERVDGSTASPDKAQKVAEGDVPAAPDAADAKGGEGVAVDDHSSSQGGVIDILSTPTLSSHVPNPKGSKSEGEQKLEAPKKQPAAQGGKVAPKTKDVKKKASEVKAAPHAKPAEGDVESANHSRTSSRHGSASEGRHAIRRSVDKANMGEGGLTTGVHLNAAMATPLEEYTRFRRHYQVSPSYKGPIYVAEDVMVPCVACGGPLDPIQRVPVGKLFFHRHCVECYLCGLKSLTEPYFQVGDRAVCTSCAEKGDARCVPREEAKSRRMILGAIKGNAYDAFRNYDRQRRLVVGSSTLNHPTVPGVSAPSLSVGLLHNRRNTTKRTFELVQRQQHYTQNDCNILFKALEDTGAQGSTQQKRIANKMEDLPRIK